MTTDSKPANTVDHRFDFVFLFDVLDGNPNGDPDSGNMPRVDPQSLQGFVTDVCLKRKIRNAIAAVAGQQPGYDLYFQTQDAAYEKRILNKQHDLAREDLASKGELAKEDDKNPKTKADNTALARKWMCKHFFDIRAFGAVMTTGTNCGQVRGPVQITFARSIDPILPMDIAITRKSVTTVEEAEKQAKKDGSITGTMGRKNTVPYGLYRGYGFVNPFLAGDTGFTAEDLQHFWTALAGQMWELDRSASRGLMCTRGLYVFEHDSKLGNASAHDLFERIKVAALGPDKAPRSFQDYRVDVNDKDLPSGVSLHKKVG